ncbi:hypothetical protein B0H14DRAFT_3512448 [Mycena olivaceomarginata]|nr:hypothetical protein B0H14DRAFT_3512448 [Mycena olivaceomarginata]
MTTNPSQPSTTPGCLHNSRLKRTKTLLFPLGNVIPPTPRALRSSTAGSSPTSSASSSRHGCSNTAPTASASTPKTNRTSHHRRAVGGVFARHYGIERGRISSMGM